MPTSISTTLWLQRAARALLATLLVVAAGMLAWQHWRDGGEADRLAAQLLVAAPQERRALVDRLLELKRPGVEELIAMLASTDAAVADAAQQGLERQIVLCQTNADSGQRQRLAELLAQHVQQLSPDGRRRAASLATSLMLDAPHGADESALLLACQRVLEHASAYVPQSRPRPPAQQAAAPPARAAVDNPLRKFIEPAELSSSAGPVLLTPPARNAPHNLQPPPQVAADQLAPASDAGNSAALPARQEAVTEQLTFSSSSRGGVVTLDQEPQGRPLSDTPLTPESAVPLGQRDALSLLRLLHTADSRVAAAAEAELIRRGLSGRTLQVARQLTHPNAAVRRQWAEALPGLTGIDAKDWLLLLSHDEDAQVRRTALAYLATSNDPRLLARVRELAAGDPDPQVQEQAARLSGDRPKLR